MRRIDFAEIIRRVGRNGIAAIWAVAHAGINGHAARLAADMVAVVVILRYSAGSEAHGRFLSFLLAIRGEIPSCQLPRLPLQRTLALRACARLHIFIRICPQRSSSISSKRPRNHNGRACRGFCRQGCGRLACCSRYLRTTSRRLSRTTCPRGWALQSPSPPRRRARCG